MRRQHLWHVTMIVIMIGMLFGMQAGPVSADSGTGSTTFDTTSINTRFVDVVVGDSHTCGLRANGTVMCWGYNGDGQLGLNDGAVRYSLYPVEVVGVTDAIAISAGGNITCIIRRDLSMACWGHGYHGDNPDPYVRWGATTVTGMRDIVQIAVANAGTCARNKYDLLMCWGHNSEQYRYDYWLPGSADFNARSTWSPRIVITTKMKNFAIRNARGAYHSRRICFIRENNSLSCVGANFDASLGIGYSSYFEHNQMTVLNLGNYVEKFAIGANGGCAILSDTTTNCWGWYGPTAVPIDTPEPFVDVYGSNAQRYYFKGQSGKVYAIGDNWNGALGVNSVINPWNILTEIPEINGATQIAGADHQHGCAVLASGRIRCWGQNPWGQLGNGTQTGSLVPVNIAMPGEPVVPLVTTAEDAMSAIFTIRRHPDDGAETAFMRITNIAGGTLYRADGVTVIPTGSYVPVSVTEAGLRFKPNANLYGLGVGSYMVQASTRANLTGVSPVLVTGRVDVTAVADPPLVSDAETYEDVQSYDGLIIRANPVDGAEITHFVIDSYSGGQLYRPDGSTPLAFGSIIDATTAGQGLRFTPSSNSVVNGTVNIKAATSATGQGASESRTAQIIVRPVVDGAPTLSGVSTQEDEMSRADIVIRRNMVDGDEIKFFRVMSDAPGRIYLNDGTTMVVNGGFVSANAAAAGLRFKPNPNAYGTYAIQAQAALSPTADGVGGEYATARIVITAVADAPQITDTEVNEGAQSTSGLVITPNSADGAEVSHFRIANIVGGRLFLNDGVSGVLIGQYITAAQAAAGLRFSAPAISLSDGYIEVQAATGTSPTLTSASKAKGNIRVNDLTPPQLVLPYDMILQSYYDSGTQLQYTATAHDLRDGDVAIACDKVSGIVLPVGSHTVQCQARDTRGNTATGSFRVIVQKIAPAVQLASIGAVSGNDVVLNWNLNPVIDEPYLYEIQRRAMPSGEWLTVKNNVSERTATIRSIGEVNYAFRVRAYFAGGAAGEWSNTVSTTIDETPPPISAWINRGTGTGQSAEGTSNTRVRLTLQSGTNDPAVMWRWSQDGITFSAWQSYQSKNEITLSGNDGYKEIRVEARDKVGNVGVTHTGIILNRDTYNGYRITINNDDEFTAISTVNLAINVPFTVFPPIAEMQLSTNGTFSDATAWEPFAFARSWTFTDTGSETYQIYVRFRTVDGGVTQFAYDTIAVDRAPPQVLMRVKSLPNSQVQVSLSTKERPLASEGRSPIKQMQIAPANEFATSRWSDFTAQTTINYATQSTSSQLVYARFRDAAGNITGIQCLTIKGGKCAVDESLTSNQAPTLAVTAPYRIVAGQIVELNAETFVATDIETPANTLVYTLVVEPSNGWLLYGGTRMSAGTRFTATDLARKRIIYRHNGSAQEHDRLVVQVDDGQLSSNSATLWFLMDGIADPAPTATATASPTASSVPSLTATASPTSTASRTPTNTRQPGKPKPPTRTPKGILTPQLTPTATTQTP